MSDYTSIWLADAEKTAISGASLGQTLYTFPVDLHLSGELGVGKTSFLQGLAKFLGINDPLTSPTYSLEQRYTTNLGIPFIHIDFYRLGSGQANELLHATEDHTGIRAIEWADRLKHRTPAPHSVIRIDITDEGKGRNLMCSFQDAPMPSREDILAWRKETMLPRHIQEHCDVVADVCDKLADAIAASGRLVRKAMLRRAAEVHDLLRFIDFKPGISAGPYTNDYSDAELKTFAEWKKRYPGMKHEAACATFLEEQGYTVLAEIVRPHGLFYPSPKRPTTEQKLLFYADKRVKFTEPVSLEVRFADFRERYGNSKESDLARGWFNEAKEVEGELFPDGAPPFR